ncbi:MAG: GntR family transcriptional regulator [Chthoniobacter sp.]|nr:GntR family transcriptional regulator [Chthoniobacter sp.]
MPLALVSSVDQVVAHLRTELRHERWAKTMPGVLRLEKELGVNRKTVEAALRQLEREGLLAGQGAGRRRLIVRTGRRPLRARCGWPSWYTRTNTPTKWAICWNSCIS